MVDIAVQIGEEIAAQLDALAREYDSTRERLIIDAIERFAKDEAEFVEAIRVGDEDFAAGRFIEHEELMAQFRLERKGKRAA